MIHVIVHLGKHFMRTIMSGCWMWRKSMKGNDDILFVSNNLIWVCSAAVGFYSDFSSWGHKDHSGNRTFASEMFRFQQEVLFFSSAEEPRRRDAHSPGRIHSWRIDFSHPHLQRLKAGPVPPAERISVQNLHPVKLSTTSPVLLYELKERSPASVV